MARVSKHYFIRDGYIHVCGSRRLIQRMGATPPDANKYYRRATGMLATEENIAYIEEHAVEVLLHIVVKKSIIERKFGAYALQALESTSQNRSASTQKTYISQVKRFINPFFEHFMISDISHSDIRNWQNAMLEQGRSKHTTAKTAMLFRYILQEAQYDGLIETNPFRRVKIIKPDHPKRKEPYTNDEIEQIIEHADGWFRAYFITSLMTGLRPSEIRYLRWENIDFKYKRINIFQKKTKRWKTIPVIPAVEKALLLHYENSSSDEWVFPSEHGKPFTENKNINKYHFKPLLQKLGIPYKSLHVTRHMFASVLISNGMDINWVSRVMGHTNIETTLKYYNIYNAENSFDKNAQVANNIIKTTFSIKDTKEK